MERVPVDIVMATNRASRYLPETLASVRAQTYQDWQLIIVDDGTPDPAAVPRAVGGMPRTTIIRQANRGLPAARNVGIAHGGAPFVALIDDDDLWHPNKLAGQVASLAKAPDALAAFTAGRYIDSEGSGFGAGWPARTVPSQLFVSGAEPQPRIVSLMIRRSAHALVGGFNESYSVGEDNEFILRLALRGPMVAVPDVLVSYRRHDANMSAADAAQGRRATLRMLKEQAAVHRGDAEVSASLAEYRERFFRIASDECLRSLAEGFRRRNPQQILEELQWGLTSSPRHLARAAKLRLTRDR